MPTPSSGTISIQQINAEFGRGNNLNAYRGTTWFTPQGGSGTFSSGAISMSEFYNKQPNSPTFSFTISSNQTNANLRTLAVNAGWNQSSQVIATISGGVYLSSNSTGTPGLTVNGSFPGGVQLVNNGFIIGMGGAGGRGRQAELTDGTSGSAGGLALSVSTSITITNNGTIAGGGGGGGGGGAGSFADKGTVFGSGGGGGGGGRSSAAANSSGNTGGRDTVSGGIWPHTTGGGSGGSGTLSSAGGGGSGSNFSSYYGGSGGSGGGWGANGNTGNQGLSAFNDGTPWGPRRYGLSGGGGGAAVSGNGNISWAATGTRLGAIT